MDRMTAAEINRRLAKALGWEWWGWALGIPNALTSGPHAGKSFSPATDSNHLREYVLPEIERRELEYKYSRLVLNMRDLRGKEHPRLWEDMWHLITAKPRVLALAALRVLEGTT